MRGEQESGVVKQAKQLRERSTLSDLVAVELRKKILSGEIAMGSELNQVAIADELDVGRAAVREAFRELAADGLIDLNPYRRAVVSRPSVEELHEVLAVRQELEVLALRWAIPRIGDENLIRLHEIGGSLKELTKRYAGGVDDGEAYWEWLRLDSQWHTTLYQASGNATLCEVIAGLRSRIGRYIQNAKPVPRYEQALKEHRQILEAVVEKDVNAAESELRNHIQGTKKWLIATVTSKFGADAPKEQK